jgi:hypothetical protein
MNSCPSQLEAIIAIATGDVDAVAALDPNADETGDGQSDSPV